MFTVINSSSARCKNALTIALCIPRRKIKGIKFLLFCTGMFSCSLLMAQTTKQQSIDESQLGWYKVYKFKGASEVKKIDNRVYSIAQQSIADSLANWMQASYLPKAGIGDIKKNLFPTTNIYSPWNETLPQGYGAIASVWSISYNSQGKLERISETQSLWTVQANDVPGWPIHDLSSNKAYYFTIPSFEVSRGHEKMNDLQDLSKVASLKPYITFWMKNLEAGGGTEYVLLTKDNKSPFIKLTKGEYLDLLEKAIPRLYEAEKQSIHSKNAGNQRSIDYLMKSVDEKRAVSIVSLKKIRERYSSRLHELATTRPQPSITEIENGMDVFSSHYLTDPESAPLESYVYKVDPAMYERCKADKPQWILIAWGWHPGSVKEKYMHESIINNFNFEYVYNFFFDPDKVKGQFYKPLRSPGLKEKEMVTEKSEAARKAVLDNSIHFFEDFSSTSVGQSPTGWYAKASGTGTTALVSTVDGTENKWVSIAGNKLSSNGLKPLPENFTLTYDVIVPENFTWGAKGLVLVLAKEKSEGNVDAFIRLKIRPGSGGANGEAELETKFPEGYANGTQWYVATGFSNNKKSNRIAVTIKKNGEVLQLLIDKTMTAEYTKGIPANLLFNALSFDMASSGGENDKYFVSNIRIKKD